MVQEHENKAGEGRIPNFKMVISEVETSTALVLLKSLTGRKPAELGKAKSFLFWQRFEHDRERTARKTTVCFMMFTLNDGDPSANISKLNVTLIRLKVQHGKFFYFPLCFLDKQL